MIFQCSVLRAVGRESVPGREAAMMTKCVKGGVIVEP